MSKPDDPAPSSAALIYAALSVVLSWPLVLGIGSDVPGDLGDSLLNMWILAWGAEHLPSLATGAISWEQFWTGNIFHPEPLTLALSEHLVGQTLQILPIYWLSGGNIILCYNLLFIATFALSAFGAFLLVRDLTGSARAGFIAGVIYGFLPYRIASVPHLQVMSSQWMPLALFGLNRFIVRLGEPGARGPAWRALALGVAALVMQNWSCIYYLLFFLPFLVLFTLHQLSSTGRWRDRHAWSGLAVGAAVTLALTVPFLLPYQRVHDAYGIERGMREVVQFSANLWSYVTASENIRLWGRWLRVSPHAEGETFLGFVPWVLGLVAVISLVLTRRRDATGVASLPATSTRLLRIVTWTLAVLSAMQLIALISVMMFGGFEFEVFGASIRARTPQRVLLQFLVPFGLLLAVSVRARRHITQAFRSPIAFYALAVLLAVWLSLGPEPAAGGARGTGFGLYGVLHDFIPGYNGLRVPARFAMIAGLFLAILAGFGAERILRTGSPERGRAVAIALAVLILLEGAAIPFEINRAWHHNEATPPARIYPYAAAGVPPIYARIAALPAGSVITEFPFGDGAWEIRYVYYAGAHWKPITNGYSGGFPPGYTERVARWQRISADPEAAWELLRRSGTTHVALHRNAFANPANADIVENWLESHGAQEVERFADGDALYAVAN